VQTGHFYRQFATSSGLILPFTLRLLTLAFYLPPKKKNKIWKIISHHAIFATLFGRDTNRSLPLTKVLIYKEAARDQAH